MLGKVDQIGVEIHTALYPSVRFGPLEENLKTQRYIFTELMKIFHDLHQNLDFDWYLTLLSNLIMSL